MQAAPSPARSTGRVEGRGAGLAGDEELDGLDVRTVSSYGTDMASTVAAPADSSQSHFDADQMEAMAGCTELINSGRSGDDGQLADVPAIQSFADRYAFAGLPAGPGDVPLLRRYRATLDEIAGACEAGNLDAAIDLLNVLLARTGASPQIASHDGRGPHFHVSRLDAPLATRMAAHFAMGLAWLVVAGQAGRIRSCDAPTCNDVFVDLSRNRSRRYCDSRTCGNRLHVAAYRARKQAAATS